MKKNILLLIILFLTGCSFRNEKNYISNIMNVNLDNCSIINSYDTHGGFLGDGDAFTKLSCKSFNISNNFHELPIEDNVYELLDMKQCSNNGCQNVFEKYHIPILKTGYYYFLDRKPDVESSYNFSILMYDNANKILYYYELDT